MIAAVAVVDAIRSQEGEEREPAVPTSTGPPAEGVESRAAIADRLRREGIEGRLVYTDERCVLRTLALPELEPAPAPRVRQVSCGFALSPDGRRAATKGGTWSPDSRRVAVCRGSVVAVHVGSEHADPAAVHEGCQPAWRPDGVLALVRGGMVVAASGETIVAAAAIEAAARAHPSAPDPPRREVTYEVLDSSWVNARRIALLLRIRFISAGIELRPELAVAVFEARTWVATEAALGEVWTRLAAGDGFIALRPGWLLDADAERLFPHPGAPAGAESVAVSPDRRWVAVGLRGRVTIFSISALRSGRFRSVSLPLVSRDLAWR